jgi:hypothetical protein
MLQRRLPTLMSRTALLLIGPIQALIAQVVKPSRPDATTAVHSAQASDTPVRFLVGVSSMRRTAEDDLTTGEEAGVALGLRFGYPARARLRFDADVRLQVAGLRGPCTTEESARHKCAFESNDESIGDLAASFGLSFATTSSSRIHALISPGLNTRGLDILAEPTHANWAGNPISTTVGLDVAIKRYLSVVLEYRHLRAATYLPDSQSREVAGIGDRKFRGSSFTAALSIPLRPTTADGSRADDHSQESHPAWTAFGLVVENDLPWRDESYTNGIRAYAAEVPGVRELLRFGHFGVGRSAVPCPYGGQSVPAKTKSCRVTQLAITQTMHTPVAIYDTAALQYDRPFAGTLFVSARTDLVQPRDDERGLLTVGSEFQLGVIGPSARSEQTQSMAHWLIATGAARPAGWSHQLTDRLHVEWIGDVTFRDRHMYSRRLHVDATLRANPVFGTTHRSVSGGLVGRWNPFMDKLPLMTGRAIVPTRRLMLQAAAPDKAPKYDEEFASVRDTRFALVAAVDGRLVGYNRTLTGREIVSRRALHEFSGGMQLEWRSVDAALYVLHRAREFAPSDADISGYARYWTAQLSYRPRLP